MKFRLFCLLLIPLSLFAQARKAEFKFHNRGVLWETMKDDGTIGAPDPSNRFQYYPSMDWPGGPETMVKDDQRSYMAGAGLWIGGYHEDGTLFYTENGPFSYVDQGTFEPLEERSNFIGNPDYDPAEAEQVITMRLRTTHGIEVKRTSRAWSFPGVDNFIILEYEFTNRNAGRVTDLFLGFPYLIRPSYQDFVVHNGWGDDFNRTDEIVRFDDDYKLLYAWDDTPNYTLPTDVGNYWDDQNELRTTGYAGYALLQATPAKGNRFQPAVVLWAQLLNNERYFSLTSSSAADLYKILSGQDKSLQADEEAHLTPMMLMSLGPYDLAKDESVRIVLVEAVAGISLRDALKGLEAQPMLEDGEEMLQETVFAAQKLHAANYAMKKVPPPSPALQIIPVPENQSITLNWEPVDLSWVDPLTGSPDFLEYRVYRSSLAFIGPYDLLKAIRPSRSTDVTRYFDAMKNKWIYEDNTISLGAGYFYAVTAVDAEGNESALTNRNFSPVYAIRSPAANALSVTVFPNPFHITSGFPVSGAENSIVWTNLPAECTIRVYTSNGELIKTMVHNSPFSGEETWDQLTDARQRPAPGIYFWTVESPVGHAKGTLLIIK
ncbi:MAG TPA: hypothetical protein PLO28_08900 [bacterium]|nr:hypothetical protein [bacterium]